MGTNSHRVVITGIGIVGPLGIGKEAFWSRVSARPGDADASGAARTVPEFDLFSVAHLQESAHTRHMDRYSRFAVLAAKLALDDAGFLVDAANAERVGVVFGSDYGCLASNGRHIQDYQAKGPRRVDPVVFQNTVSNTVNGFTSILLGALGPSTAVSDRVSGYLALCAAHDLVESGRADAVIAGGVEDLGGPIAAEPEFRARAVGCHRSGGTDAPADGATVLLLEDELHARARGATAYARFASYVMAPAAESKDDLEPHVRAHFERVATEVTAASGPVEVLFFESEHGRGALSAALEAAGQRALGAMPSRSLGPALGSTPTPAACALSVGSRFVPASFGVDARATPAVLDGRGCALTAKVEADGEMVVLVFEPAAEPAAARAGGPAGGATARVREG